MIRVWFLFCCAICVAAPSSALATKVLVIAWDGTAYGVVRALYQTNRLPNLKALGALGQNTSIADCFGAQCMQVMSKPQYAAILTGRRADENRVWANEIFDLIPDGMTVYEKLRAGRGANIKLAHIGGNRNVGPSIFGNIVSDVDVFIGAMGITFQDANIAKAIGLVNQWRGQDWFIFLHIVSPDHDGHQYGAESQPYKDAIVYADAVLGRLMDAVGTVPDAHIFVLGDHGMGAFDYVTGLAKPNKHDISTPSTLFVYNRAKTKPQNVYPDQLVPRWLGLFGVSM